METRKWKFETRHWVSRAGSRTAPRAHRDAPLHNQNVPNKKLVSWVIQLVGLVLVLTVARPCFLVGAVREPPQGASRCAPTYDSRQPKVDRGEQPPALRESSRALYQGSYERAASLAGDYLKAHPDAPVALILLARAEIAQGKYQLAYQELQKALRANSKNLDALYYLGRLCGILSQIEYQQLYALAPDSARVHQLLAESYRAQENAAKAEEEYKAALKADPRSVEVLDALGDLERSQFRFDEAISYYSRVAEMEPRDYDSAYGLGACYLYLQKLQRAIERFRRALTLDPDSAAARLALGDALLRAGQPAAAVTELKSAAALEPNMRQAYTLLGRAYHRLGQLREAEEALKKANELTQREIETSQGTLTSKDLISAPPIPPSSAGQPTGPDD